MNLQNYGRSQYDWPTLSFKFIAYKLLPEWRLIEFWRVFRCKKSTLFRARQVTYEMHNNTPLSHPKLAFFWFLCKKHWSNIFYTLKQYFMQLAISFIFMFGQFLLQICASGVLFCIVLVLEFFWICDIFWADCMGWRPIDSPLTSCIGSTEQWQCVPRS